MLAVILGIGDFNANVMFVALENTPSSTLATTIAHAQTQQHQNTIGLARVLLPLRECPFHLEAHFAQYKLTS
jgi:hypothetical protein